MSQVRRQLTMILAMYDEGELTLDELFELWEDVVVADDPFAACSAVFR